MRNPAVWDVAIVGAGTAGSAAAFHCARLGLSTICVDRHPNHHGGAHWINGVPGWMFTEAGLVLPTGKELVGDREPFHLFAGTGPERIVVSDHDLLDVDMGLLVERLQALALAAGAVFRGRVRIQELTDEGLVTDGATIRAKWYVDASGMTGVRLLKQPIVAATDICSAAQEVRTVTDLRAAQDFFAEYEVPTGETLSFSAVAGGFSIVNARLAGDQVALLTGSIPANGHPSGQRLLNEFVATHPWVGEKISGGHRALPLSRSHDRLADDRVALLGDAACQVFPAHGSGIGPGLVAARTLAEELAGGGSPHSYAVFWMRKWGGLLAAADQFRRFSQGLDVATLARLMSSGLISSESVGRVLEERPPSLSLETFSDLSVGALREPLLAAQLGPVFARSAALAVLYAQYPSASVALPAWIRAVNAIAAN